MIIFCLPFTPAAVPWRDEFDWKDVNYAPMTVGALFIRSASGGWCARKHTFTGPVRTIELDEGAGIVEDEPVETDEPPPAAAPA